MKFVLVLATGLSLIAGAFAATAAEVSSATVASTAALPALIGTPATAAPQQAAPEKSAQPAQNGKTADSGSDPKTKRLASLRAMASRISMQHLPRLRPYASDYRRLVSAVLGYWRRNTANPNASALTNIILRHVKDEYRFFARPQVAAGVAEGVNALRAELRKL